MTDDAMDRREALRRAAEMMLGGALSAPVLAAVLAGCGEGPRAANGDWAPRALTPEQGELVATIAEHIIPETETPGARAVGVHRFIDTMLAEYYPAGERERFLAGLADVDARARRACRKAFLRCKPEDQRALLDRLDAEAFAPAPAAPPQPPAPDPSKQTERGVSANPPGELKPAAPAPLPAPFFRTMKELTLLGYYTSEAGATRELRHEKVPGRYEGCVPLAQVGRAWAV